MLSPRGARGVERLNSTGTLIQTTISHKARTRRLAIDGGRLRSPPPPRGLDQLLFLKRLFPVPPIELRHFLPSLVSFKIFRLEVIGVFLGDAVPRPGFVRSPDIVHMRAWITAPSGNYPPMCLPRAQRLSAERLSLPARSATMARRSSTRTTRAGP